MTPLLLAFVLAFTFRIIAHANRVDTSSLVGGRRETFILLLGGRTSRE